MLIPGKLYEAKHKLYLNKRQLALLILPKGAWLLVTRKRIQNHIILYDFLFEKDYCFKSYAYHKYEDYASEELLEVNTNRKPF